MSKLLQFFFKNRPYTLSVIVLLLKFSNLLHKLISRLAVIQNNGVHPKHDIIQYEKWFCEQLKPDDVVLDVGCNNCLLSLSMSKVCKQVYGIEINPKNLPNFQFLKLPDNLQVVVGDATTYDFSHLKNINVITLSNVLEHIEYRVEFLKKLLANLPKVEKVLIRVPAIDRDWLTLYKKSLGVYWKLDPTHYTEYTEENLHQELSMATLQVEKLSIKFGEIYVVISC